MIELCDLNEMNNTRLSCFQDDDDDLHQLSNQ